MSGALAHGAGRQAPASQTPAPRRWIPPLFLLAALCSLGAGACAPKAPVRTTLPPPVAPPLPDSRPEPGVSPFPWDQLRQAPEMRILLARDVSAVELVSDQGLLILDHEEDDLARYGPGQRLQLFHHPRSPERLSVYSEIWRGAKQARAERKRLPFGQSVVIQPLKGGTLLINGREYRGRVRLVRSGDHFDCVNLVPMELYLRGVVPHEIGRLGREGFEALKAQAIASRNYALQRMVESRHRSYDMVSTVFDQVYKGAEEEWPLANLAIDQTRGQVLWIDGQPAEVYYSSTCGGASADIHEVWNHAPVSHLRKVRDADEEGRSWCRTSQYFRWRHSWSARELGAILRAYLPQAAGLPAGTPIGRLVDLNITRSTADSRASLLEVLTDTGRYEVKGDRIRSALKRDLQGNALRSIMFRLQKQYDDEGRLVRIVARGAGWGHGIGLCQVGAISRSRLGQDHRRILAAYFPGTELRRLWR